MQETSADMTDAQEFRRITEG